MSHLCFVFPGLHLSGGYRTLTEWVNRLAADGVRVTVVSAEGGPGYDAFAPGVDIRVARQGRVSTALRSAGRRVVGRREMLTLSPLLVAPLIPRRSALVLGYAPFEPRLFGHRPDLTYMQHWESVWFPEDPRAQAQIERRMRRARPAVVNSTWLLRHFGAAQRSDLHLVFPGVDLDLFRPAADGDARRRRASGAPLRIAALGRNEPFKGLADLRVAAGRLGRPVELVLFGTPDRRSAGGPVPETHLGRLAQLDLAEVYRTCDLVVTPSWYESFPLPPLEAMACGACVVTSRQGTEDYAMDGSNSFVFDGGDVRDLERALRRALAEDGPALREAARATAERFTWSNGYAMLTRALEATDIL